MYEGVASATVDLLNCVRWDRALRRVPRGHGHLLRRVAVPAVRAAGRLPRAVPVQPLLSGTVNLRPGAKRGTSILAGFEPATFGEALSFSSVQEPCKAINPHRHLISQRKVHAGRASTWRVTLNPTFHSLGIASSSSSPPPMSNLSCAEGVPRKSSNSSGSDHDSKLPKEGRSIVNRCDFIFLSLKNFHNDFPSFIFTFLGCPTSLLGNQTTQIAHRRGLTCFPQHVKDSFSSPHPERSSRQVEQPQGAPQTQPNSNIRHRRDEESRPRFCSRGGGRFHCLPGRTGPSRPNLRLSRDSLSPQRGSCHHPTMNQMTTSRVGSI